jgi:hypothetical protein
MSFLARIGRFWWTFVIGDDWRTAAGIVLALGATGALVASGVDAWWLMPVATAAILGASLRREIR